MRSSLQLALDRAESLEDIPRMIHPLSAHWHQPDRSKIVIDRTHALMSRRTFDALHEYSCSNPSGVYEGKMWKRHDGIFDAAFLRRGGKPEWLLVWFGKSENPDMCSINSRKILLIED